MKIPEKESPFQVAALLCSKMEVQTDGQRKMIEGVFQNFLKRFAKAKKNHTPSETARKGSARHIFEESAFALKKKVNDECLHRVVEWEDDASKAKFFKTPKFALSFETAQGKFFPHTHTATAFSWDL